MTTGLHQKRHEFLHKCFLELLKDYLESTDTIPTISDMVKWSSKQTIDTIEPNEGKNKSK